MIDCYATAIEQAPPSMFQNKRAGFVRRTRLNHSDSVSLLEEPEQTVFRTSEELSQAISASNLSATAPLHAIRSDREHISIHTSLSFGGWTLSFSLVFRLAISQVSSS